MARVIVPNTDVLLRQVAGPQQVGFVQREQPLNRIARIAGIFDKLVQSPTAVGALSAGREIVTGGEDAKRLEAMRRLGIPVGGKDVAAATSATVIPAPTPAAMVAAATPVAAPVAAPERLVPSGFSEGPSVPARMERSAFATRGARVTEPEALTTGIAEAAERLTPVETLTAPPAVVEAARLISVPPSLSRPAPPMATAGTMFGPKESVDARIAELEAKGDARTPIENYELAISKEQRIGLTLPPVGREARGPAGGVGATGMGRGEEPFVARTPDQIYSEARLADTLEKQASVLEKAATVFRAQPGRPQNIFEALGFGRPTGVDEDQLKIVASLFPKIQSPTEKSLADADLARARAEQLRAQAGLTGEKKESERLIRGAKQELDLAKAYKARSDAYANFYRAMNAKKGGGKRRGPDVDKNLKVLLDTQKFTEQKEMAELAALQNDIDADNKVMGDNEWTRSPAPAVTASEYTEVGKAQRKSRQEYDEKKAEYEAAKDRLEKRQARKNELEASIAENRALIADTVNVMVRGRTARPREEVIERGTRGIAGRRAPAPRTPAPAPAPATTPGRAPAVAPTRGTTAEDALP